MASKIHTVLNSEDRQANLDYNVGSEEPPTVALKIRKHVSKLGKEVILRIIEIAVSSWSRQSRCNPGLGMGRFSAGTRP